MVRHKNRYVVTVISQIEKDEAAALILKPASLHAAINNKVQQLYGDFGVAAIAAGFTAKYCNEKTRIAVIRVRHGPHRFVTSALPCIKTIENKRVKLNILYVGATIKQCFKFILVYQQQKYDQFCSKLKSDEEKAALKESIMNFDNLSKIT
ncbi:octanoyltransferase [Holotrichia oblita]|uniref:Octanoyltransferase n=1 Tax=Holotrichia oblita TaxID=644536 RepID=A0ACB9T622_HOLOL|nr:octanoyltransferase [Holotrichia oblita]